MALHVHHSFWCALIAFGRSLSTYSALSVFFFCLVSCVMNAVLAAVQHVCLECRHSIYESTLQILAPSPLNHSIIFKQHNWWKQYFYSEDFCFLCLCLSIKSEVFHSGMESVLSCYFILHTQLIWVYAWISWHHFDASVSVATQYSFIAVCITYEW